jgi:hypothetical protein
MKKNDPTLADLICKLRPAANLSKKEIRIWNERKAEMYFLTAKAFDSVVNQGEKLSVDEAKLLHQLIAQLPVLIE